jgi:hypothetical protein
MYGIRFSLCQLSTVLGETLIAQASCRRFNNAKSSIAARRTNTLRVDAATCRSLAICFVVIAKLATTKQNKFLAESAP